jgi:hypothetical protein
MQRSFHGAPRLNQRCRQIPNQKRLQIDHCFHHQISTNAAGCHFAEPPLEAESHFRYLGFIASVIKQEQREELATQARTEPPTNRVIVVRVGSIAVHENRRFQIVTRMVEFGQQRVNG